MRCEGIKTHYMIMFGVGYVFWYQYGVGGTGKQREKRVHGIVVWVAVSVWGCALLYAYDGYYKVL